MKDQQEGRCGIDRFKPHSNLGFCSCFSVFIRIMNFNSHLFNLRYSACLVKGLSRRPRHGVIALRQMLIWKYQFLPFICISKFWCLHIVSVTQFAFSNICLICGTSVCVLMAVLFRWAVFVALARFLMENAVLCKL